MWIGIGKEDLGAEGGGETTSMSEKSGQATTTVPMVKAVKVGTASVPSMDWMLACMDHRTS